MKFFFTIIFSIALLNASAQSTACYVPTRLQTQSNWCWAACTEMIADGYGHNISQCQAVQDAKNKIGDCLSGGSSLNACSYPSSNNYTNWVVGCRGSCSDLLTNNYSVRSSSFIKNGNFTDFKNDVWSWLVGDRPFIAGGWFGGGGLNNGHAIVIESYNKTANTMGYDDPAFGYTSATTNWIYSKILVAAVPDNAKPGGRGPVVNVNNNEVTANASTTVIFPNPVSSGSMLTISNLQLKNASSLRVLNAMGVTLHEEKINTSQKKVNLSIANYPKGTYFALITENGRTTSIKFIVQ